MSLARPSVCVLRTIFVIALLLRAPASAQTTFTTGQTASGTFTNVSLNFLNNSSAGSSTILTTSANVAFYGNSTAGNAAITNTATGNLFFDGSSSAGSASITNSSINFAFLSNTSAGSALITNNAGGLLTFRDNASGGTALLTNHGTLDVSGLSGSGIAFGHIAGSGTFSLGSKALTVGSMNNDTTVSGVLADGGFSGGTGASLTKVGIATLILTGANTYTGGTTVSAGTLQIGNGSTSGSITGNIVNNALVRFSRSDAVTFTGIISGTGSVRSLDGGSLTFTGDHTYTGTTRVSNTLRLGNGGTSGSLTGNIINDGHLIFDRSDASTYAGVISSTGSVTKTGAGTLTLTGANTYTGQTQITGGLINFSSLENLGTGGIRLNGGGLQWASGNTADISSRFNGIGDAGATFDTNGNDITIASEIFATAGSLTKTGSGTLTLSGITDYSGDTIIAAGSLHVSGNLRTNYPGSIANAGALIVSGPINQRWSGPISGTGTLTKQGTGVLILTGDNLYTGLTTIAAGTLRIGNGGATGSLVGDVVNQGNLTFDRSGSSSYAGTLSGSGSFTKAGSGALTLSGDNTYTGGTTISTGTLTATHANALGVNGALTVASGATLNTSALASFTVGSLSGAGTINAGGGVFTTTQSGDTTFAGVLSGTGRLAMNGTGTLTLTGNNTFTAATFANAGTIVFSNLNNLGQGANFQFNGGTLRWATGSSADLSTKNVILNAGGGTIDTNGNNVTLANAIGNNGPGALVKVGAGTLSLAGANTYTGGTTVNAGMVSFSSLASFGTGSLTLNGGGLRWSAGTTTDISSRLTALNFANTVFDTNGNNVTLASGLSGTGILTKSGAGTLTLAGANTRTGGTTLAAGTLALGHADALGITGTISFTGGSLQFSAANTTDYSSRLSSAAGQPYSINTGGQSVTFASALTSVGGSLTKLGTGTLTLTATNTYTGLTTVSGGFLDLSGTGRLTGAVQIGSQGTLRFQDSAIASSTSALTNQGNVSFHSDASAGSANITNTHSGQVSFQGSSTSGSANITNNNGHVSFSGSSTSGSAGITNDSGSVSFESMATAGSANITNNYGNVSFSGNSTAGFASFANVGGSVDFYTAATAGSASFTNDGGVFNFHDDSTAGAAHLTNLAGGQLYFNGNSTGGSAQLVNRGYLDLGNLAAPTITFGSLAGDGTFHLGFAAVTVGSNHTSTTLSGVVSDWGTASLTKVGTGTLTLAGDNTYGGGTTVSAGTLLANNPAGSATGSGAITVNSGATLGGSGFIGGLATFNSGARLAPGNSPGTLTFSGGLTLQSGSILDFQLGTTSDLIVVAGGTLTGPSSGLVTLNFSDSGGFAAGTYTLVNYTAATLSDFQTTDFSFGSTIPGYTYALALAGNSLQLTATASAIPEPSTYAAIFGALALGLAVYRRRKTPSTRSTVPSRSA